MSTTDFGAMAQRIVDKFHREYPEGTKPAETTIIAMEYLKLRQELAEANRALTELAEDLRNLMLWV